MYFSQVLDLTKKIVWEPGVTSARTAALSQEVVCILTMIGELNIWRSEGGGLVYYRCELKGVVDPGYFRTIFSYPLLLLLLMMSDIIVIDSIKEIEEKGIPSKSREERAEDDIDSLVSKYQRQQAAKSSLPTRSQPLAPVATKDSGLGTINVGGGLTPDDIVNKYMNGQTPDDIVNKYMNGQTPDDIVHKYAKQAAAIKSQFGVTGEW